MKIYSVTKARENLEKSAPRVLEVREKIKTDIVNHLNKAIEGETLTGVKSISLSYAQVQQLAFRKELEEGKIDKEAMKYHHMILTQYGEEVMRDVLALYKQEGYTVTMSDKVLRLEVV